MAHWFHLTPEDVDLCTAEELEVFIKAIPERGTDG